MLSAKQKAKANKTCQDLDLLDITKAESNNCFIILCFDKKNDKNTVAWNWIDLAVGNPALRMQPTD